MASCNPVIPDFATIEANSEIEVIAKYKSLMKATICDESIYERTKVALFVHFQDLQITELEKAKIVGEYMAQLSTQMSAVSMQSAVSWAKEERDASYVLAKVKAETELLLANRIKAEEEICLVQAQVDKVNGELELAYAKSIRENGDVVSFGADGMPDTLDTFGLKYEQTKQVKAATYSSLAETYRKSGQVTIATDPLDDIIKGTDATDGGHTYWQAMVARRQIQSFEDSKRNHVANSSSQTIGQFISAEIDYDPSNTIIPKYVAALDYLLTDSSDPINLPSN